MEEGNLLSIDSKFRLLAAFRHLGQRINLSTFNDRLVFQKQVYLLQELGIKLGYSYGWYRRGPYSRDAASDGFQLENIQNAIENLPELTKDETTAVNTLQELIVEAKERFETVDTAYCMELLGSLHFLLIHGYPRPSSEEEAIQRFNQLKPKFTDNAKGGLVLLSKKNLI